MILSLICMEKCNKEIFHKYGKKWTQEREEILTFLQEIHIFSSQLLLDRFPKLGRASIFRTIALFLEMWIVRRVNLWSKGDEYEYIENSSVHHEHMKCEKCGIVMSFESDFICKLLAKVCKNKGFTLKEHSVSLLGFCEKCK